MHGHFILGINYWPRHHGVRMWQEWDPSEIEREFVEIKKLGLEVVRIFLLWRDFQPRENYVDEQALSYFDELLNIAHKCSMRIVPTFFVGNMSGEVWDIPWRRGRDVYKNPALLNAQLYLVRLFAERYKENGRIVFWDLANEPDLGFAASSTEDTKRWSRLLYGEIKKYDTNHPVTMGMHQGSLLKDNKFRPQDLSSFTDFMSMHAYPIYTTLCPDPPNSIRPTYLPAFLCQLTSALTEKKVLIEEFGVSSQLMSEQQQQNYYESVLFSLISNGALGALAWCFSDYSQDESSPYNTTPYEVSFGITSKEGREKPGARAIRKFSSILKKSDFSKLRREEPKAAIAVPRCYHDNPDEEISAEITARVLFSSYLLAKQAGYNVDLISLEDDFAKYRLIFLPSIPRRGALNVKDWHKIMGYVNSGGTVYCSYHGVAFQELEDFFGMSIEYIADVDSGSITFTSTGEKPLPVEINIKTVKSNRLLLQDAERIWMRNQYGEVAIASRSYGKGHAVFCVYPVELYISYIPNIYSGTLLYRVYEEIAKTAGLFPTINKSPGVEGCLFYSGNRRVIVLTNHQSKQIAVKLPGNGKNVQYKDIYSNEIISQADVVLQGNEGKVLEFI